MKSPMEIDENVQSTSNKEQSKTLVDINASNIEQDWQLNEEYKKWKQNCHYLYDLLISKKLAWPSLTCQWFPDLEDNPDKNYTTKRLLIGTHTSNTEQDYLQIFDVNIPKQPLNKEEMEGSKDESIAPNEFGSIGDVSSKLNINQKIPHEGEINRARYMPQNSNIIATRTSKGDVLVFDITKHPNEPVQTTNISNFSSSCKPDIRLKYHTKEGYGMSWNTLKEGSLLTCSEDFRICLWDIQGYSKEKEYLSPVSIFDKNNSSPVQDVCFNPINDSIFAAVYDDKKFVIWDARIQSLDPIKTVNDAHESDLYCVAFNPYFEYLLATGSKDTTIGLWDMRNLNKSLHYLRHHEGEVLQLNWSPHSSSILSSCSDDHKVLIWDLSLIGEDQSNDDAQDGPGELLFDHGGHTNRVSDICFDINTPWLMASTAGDNIIQIWQMSPDIYLEDEQKTSKITDKME